MKKILCVLLILLVCLLSACPIADGGEEYEETHVTLTEETIVSETSGTSPSLSAAAVKPKDNSRIISVHTILNACGQDKWILFGFGGRRKIPVGKTGSINRR